MAAGVGGLTQFYLGEVSNKIAARARIPIAENAVRALRTLGLANTVAARPIMVMRKEYQTTDVRA